MNKPKTLKQWCDEERGRAADLARKLSVQPTQIYLWASGERPVPEERAAWLEWFTGHECTCEQLCPGVKWVRVRAQGWPGGKPLIDKAPEIVVAVAPPPTVAPA